MEDPLPDPYLERNSVSAALYCQKSKQFIALTVCLFLGLTIIICSHVGIEETKHGLWIIKLHSSINQAPRGGFFGALAILPQKTNLDSVLSPQMWENNYSVFDIFFLRMRNWLVMIWYGSSYI